MTIFLECPECQNRIEDWKAAKLPDKTRVKLCEQCGLRYAVIADEIEAAAASGQGSVVGVATAHQRRGKVAKPATGHTGAETCYTVTTGRSRAEGNTTGAGACSIT